MGTGNWGKEEKEIPGGGTVTIYTHVVYPLVVFYGDNKFRAVGLKGGKWGEAAYPKWKWEVENEADYLEYAEIAYEKW